MRGYYRKQRGQALIEFMIFLPLTVIFALSLIEVGMVFNTFQRVTNISREAANTALRLCWEEKSDEESFDAWASRIGGCLQNTALPVLRDSVAPNTFRDFSTRGQVMISAYYWNTDTSASVAVGCFAGGKSSVCASRFNKNSSGTLIENLNLIFVGECLYNYGSLMNLNFFSVPWEIYDRAVF